MELSLPEEEAALERQQSSSSSTATNTTTTTGTGGRSPVRSRHEKLLTLSSFGSQSREDVLVEKLDVTPRSRPQRVSAFDLSHFMGVELSAGLESGQESPERAAAATVRRMFPNMKSTYSPPKRSSLTRMPSREEAKKAQEDEQEDWVVVAPAESQQQPQQLESAVSEEKTAGAPSGEVSASRIQYEFDGADTSAGADLSERVGRTAALLEMDLLELWRFVDDQEQLIYCSYAHSSRLLQAAYPGVPCGRYPYIDREVAQSAALCSLASQAPSKHCWRVRQSSIGSSSALELDSPSATAAVTAAGSARVTADERFRASAQAEMALFIAGDSPSAALFVVGFAMRPSPYRPGKIEFAHKAFAGLVAAFSSNTGDAATEDDELEVEGGVVPVWEPRRSFHFPVRRLQVRHCLPALLGLGDLRGVTFVSRGARVDVHSAYLRSTGERVAVKMLRRDCLDSALAMQELTTECGLLARVNHPNLVRLVGAGEVPRPFIAVEWLPSVLGAELKAERSFFASPFGRREDECARRFNAVSRALELAEALEYLHLMLHPEAAIIHRDLKPDNVGFTADGSLKLFDLGLCTCVYRASHASDKYEMTRNTGSLRYMAPEVGLGKAYNEKVDVYSFGIMVWQMVSNATPFADVTPTTFVSRVFEGGLRPAVDPSWPTSLSALLKRCWAADADLRPSFETIVSELGDMLDKEIF